MTGKDPEGERLEVTGQFSCPWCDYEFRKERYFGRHVFEEHVEKLLEGRLDDPYSMYECRDCGEKYADTTGDHCPECGGADVMLR